MFDIVNNTSREIEELNYLNEYINFIVKKEKLSNCIFNIIFVLFRRKLWLIIIESTKK